MNCGSCLYFTRTAREKKWGAGRCHRFPPTVVQLGEPEQRGACFPLVDENEWCGEYRKSPETKTPETKNG